MNLETNWYSNWIQNWNNCQTIKTMSNGDEQNFDSSKRYHQIVESLIKEKKLNANSSDPTSDKKQDLIGDKNALAVPNSSANDIAPDSAEASAQVFDKKRKNHIRLSQTNLKVITLFFVLLLLLTLISFAIAFSSVFRKQSDLSMERSSYYWYFIYATFILVSIMTVIPLFWGLKHGLIRVSLVSRSLIILAVIMMCEMLLISRFSFVTFPVRTISESTVLLIQLQLILSSNRFHFRSNGSDLDQSSQSYLIHDFDDSFV